MKQFMFIIAVLLIYSCANNKYNEPESERLKNSESIEMSAFDTEETSSVTEEQAYTTLITQKLQDHLDIGNLSKTHPDFNIEIDKKKLFLIKKNTAIASVKFLDSIHFSKDSMIQLKTKVNFTNSQTDTIISYIKTSTATIDGEVFKTYKVEFSKNNQYP